MDKKLKPKYTKEEGISFYLPQEDNNYPET